MTLDKALLTLCDSLLDEPYKALTPAKITALLDGDESLMQSVVGYLMIRDLVQMQGNVVVLSTADDDIDRLLALMSRWSA